MDGTKIPGFKSLHTFLALLIRVGCSFRISLSSRCRFDDAIHCLQLSAVSHSSLCHCKRMTSLCQRDCYTRSTRWSPALVAPHWRPEPLSIGLQVRCRRTARPRNPAILPNNEYQSSCTTVSEFLLLILLPFVVSGLASSILLNAAFNQYCSKRSSCRAELIDKTFQRSRQHHSTGAS